MHSYTNTHWRHQLAQAEILSLVRHFSDLNQGFLNLDIYLLVRELLKYEVSYVF